MVRSIKFGGHFFAGGEKIFPRKQRDLLNKVILFNENVIKILKITRILGIQETSPEHHEILEKLIKYKEKISD